MIILESVAAFAHRYHSAKKWQRCLEALSHGARIKPWVCHSIGDTLVYRLEEGAVPAAPCFTGHRRYVEIHHYLDGAQAIAHGAKGALTALAPYSDETDRETFTGDAAASHTARAGEVLIFDNAHAYRPLAAPRVRKLVLLVTVEGATFHNK
jgi:evolved beta-galactosidase subunit beta